MIRVILLLIFAVSCITDKHNIELTGSLAIHPTNTNKFIVINNNDSVVFNFPKKREFPFSGFTWLHKTDSFLCIENIETKEQVPVKSNLVLVNKRGTILRHILITEKGEFIQHTFPSPNDNYLIITSIKDVDKKVSAIFTTPIYGLIINFNNNIFIRNFHNISPRINFEMKESPWSPDESMIVYAILPGKPPIVIGEKLDNKEKIDHGIFIYDINENRHTKILDDGHNAIWSPTKPCIAYVVDKKIYLYNIIDKTSTLLYKSGKVKIELIHWTSDGKYLLVIQANYNGFERIINEIFVNIVNREIIKAQKPMFGMNDFTWKGSIKVLN